MSDDTIVRGNTGVWYHSITDRNGNRANLAGFTVWFTAKVAVDEVATDTGAAIKHHIAVAADGTVVSAVGFALGGTDYLQTPPAAVQGAASGVLTQTLTAAECSLLAVRSYVYDLQIKDATGFVDTPVVGLTVTITADVTRRVTVP